MKELSIEEKARAYDELIERLKDLKFAYRFSPLSDTIEEKFPELKESNDERIRKLLSAYFAKFKPDDMWDDDFSFGDILAWLEKQGKNNMGISKATKQELEDNLNKALEKETQESLNEFLDEQGEQKPVDKVEPKFKVGDRIKKIGIGYESWVITDIDEMRNEYEGRYEEGYSTSLSFFEQDNFELVEQKPAGEVGNYDHKEVIQTIINEQKPTWSEEDETKIKNIIAFLKSPALCCMESNKGIIDASIKYLKSLKDRVQPQSTWKPSDE